MDGKTQMLELRLLRIRLHGRKIIYSKRTDTHNQEIAALPLRTTLHAGSYSNVWWPRLQGEEATIARECEESGKNVKTLLRQKQVGKLPENEDNIQQTAKNFTGSFQNAIQAKRHLLISLDHFSRRSEAKF